VTVCKCVEPTHGIIKALSKVSPPKSSLVLDGGRGDKHLQELFPCFKDPQSLASPWAGIPPCTVTLVALLSECRKVSHGVLDILMITSWVTARQPAWG
jgi:hypothetical protein